MDIEHLKNELREAFPACAFSRVRVADGQYNTVLVLDEKWAFRFPKSAGYRATFEREVRLLRAFAPQSPVPVPEYAYVSPKGFGGYRLILGEPLTNDRFAALPPDARQSILARMAAFLSTLHGLDPAIIGTHLASDHQWDPDDLSLFTKRYCETRREKIAPYIGAHMLRMIDAFYPLFETLKSPQTRVVHRDLRDAHILEHEGALSGIIDFADAAVADPAYDFAYFRTWGDDALETLLGAYAFPDDTLRARTHLHFIRYQIDQIFYAIRGDTLERIPALTASLDTHLPQVL